MLPCNAATTLHSWLPSVIIRIVSSGMLHTLYFLLWLIILVYAVIYLLLAIATELQEISQLMVLAMQPFYLLNLTYIVM